MTIKHFNIKFRYKNYKFTKPTTTNWCMHHFYDLQFRCDLAQNTTLSHVLPRILLFVEIAIYTRKKSVLAPYKGKIFETLTVQAFLD